MRHQFGYFAFFTPALELHAEGSHADSQGAGGADAMAFELLERAENHLLFDIRQRTAGEALGDGGGVLALEPGFDGLARMTPGSLSRTTARSMMFCNSRTLPGQS